MHSVVAMLVHAEHDVGLVVGRGAKRSDRLGGDLSVRREERHPRAGRRADTGLEPGAHPSVAFVSDDGGASPAEDLSSSRTRSVS